MKPGRGPDNARARCQKKHRSLTVAAPQNEYADSGRIADLRLRLRLRLRRRSRQSTGKNAYSTTKYRSLAVAALATLARCGKLAAFTLSAAPAKSCTSPEPPPPDFFDRRTRPRAPRRVFSRCAGNAIAL